MRPVVSSTGAIWLLLGVVGIRAQNHQGRLREFFGVPYKHPETAVLAAAREKAFNEMLWIQGMLSGSIVFIFVAGLYSVWAKAKADAAARVLRHELYAERQAAERSERLKTAGGSSTTFEIE